MSYVEPHDSGRRVTGMAVVVVFHVILGYALVHGLARKIVEVVRSPLETKIIEEIKPPPPDKPPPPPPKLAAPPPPFIPPPEIQIAAPPSGPTITAVTPVKPTVPVPPPAAPAPPPPPKPHVPVRTAAAITDAEALKAPYPAAARRANEEGLVRLNYLCDVNGTIADAKVVQTSGFRRLDDAARTALIGAKCRPATVDGKPERSWAPLEYQWRLE